LNHTKINPRVRRYIILGACIALPVLVLLLAIRLVIIGAFLGDTPADFYTNSTYQKDVLLENFPIYQQAYANSCGPTTISMAYSYLVEPISEQELADKLGFALGQSGMLPPQFYQALSSALGGNGFQVAHQANITNTKFLERAYLQLKQGIPVPIYFSTINDWDKPNYDTHYSLIIGMRPQKSEVVIANAYGFLEEMPISELLRAIKYDNFRNAPLDFRLGLFVGLINRNNLFLIVK
jgi:hypothetical protein